MITDRRVAMCGKTHFIYEDLSKEARGLPCQYHHDPFAAAQSCFFNLSFFFCSTGEELVLKILPGNNAVAVTRVILADSNNATLTLGRRSENRM